MIFFFFCFFFFFSSRRRHTRWTGDWSSDVCSSDLLLLRGLVGRLLVPERVVRLDGLATGERDRRQHEKQQTESFHGRIVHDHGATAPARGSRAPRKRSRAGPGASVTSGNRTTASHKPS